MNIRKKIVTLVFILSSLFLTTVYADSALEAREFSAKQTSGIWNTKKLKIPGATWYLNYKRKNMKIIKDSQKGDVIKLIGIKPEWQEISLLDKEFLKKCADEGKLVLEMELRPTETIAGKMYFKIYCVASSLSNPGKSFIIDLNLFSDKIVCSRKKIIKANLSDRWIRIKIIVNTKTNTWTVKLDGKKIAVNKEKPRKLKHLCSLWFGDGSQSCAGVVLVNKVIVSSK